MYSSVCIEVQQEGKSNIFPFSLRGLTRDEGTLFLFCSRQVRFTGEQ